MSLWDIMFEKQWGKVKDLSRQLMDRWTFSKSKSLDHDRYNIINGIKLVALYEFKRQMETL